MPLEDAALGNGVVHHLALPRGIAHKVGIGFGLGLRPFVSPDGGSVAVDGVDLGDLHTGYIGDILQHHVLGKAITDHEEAATADIQGAEERLLDPVGSLTDTLLIVAHLVVVEVVDDDVVRALLLLLESTGRLSPADGEPLDAAGGGELALLPVAHVLLRAEVGNESLVILQFGL